MLEAFFSVVNWEEFQHYKRRNPPWIKLYGRVLDDYQFSRLADFQKFQIMGIWILAGKMENKIPNDPDWIKAKINSEFDVDLENFCDLNFIENCDAEHELKGASKRLSKSKQKAPRSVSVSVSDSDKLKDQINELFLYWIDAMGKNPNKVKLTAERHKKLHSRLKTYSVDEVKSAIDNCARSPFHQGQDGKNTTVYNDIELICRNDTQFEKFRDMVIGNDEHSNTDW